MVQPTKIFTVARGLLLSDARVGKTCLSAKRARELTRDAAHNGEPCQRTTDVHGNKTWPASWYQQCQWCQQCWQQWQWCLSKTRGRYVIKEEEKARS